MGVCEGLQAVLAVGWAGGSGGPCRLIGPLRLALSSFLGGDDTGRLLASPQQPGPALPLPVGQGVGRRGSH